MRHGLPASRDITPESRRLVTLHLGGETPEWERESAAAVYDQVCAFIEATGGNTVKLTRSQKGRFVALCWIGQIFKYFPDPKPGYVADWDDLPRWLQEVDADIFERIERDA